MAEIEDWGLEEVYADLIKIEGRRGTVFLMYEHKEKPPMELAAELGLLLDGNQPDPENPGAV